MTTLLMIHICGATVGLLSGYLAMVFRKGSGLHNAAGTVFVASMLGMTLSAVFMATYLRPNAMNCVAGLLTFYLVITAAWTAKHREARTGIFDRSAALLVWVVAMGAYAFGLEAANRPRGILDHVPAPIYFVFGSVALLHGISDIRLLIRGGVSGTRRIARHLSRMCLALLITTLSFYPGQARLFPASWRQSPLIFAPHILLVGAMVFNLIRMRSRKRQQPQPASMIHEEAIAA